MRKNSRAAKFYAKAIETIDYDFSEKQVAMLQAMAVMVAEATAPKKATKKDSTKLLYTEQAVIRATGLEMQPTRWGRLNGVLSKLSLKETDLERFKSWFSNDMLPWIEENNVTVTYSMLCRKYPEWLEKARQYRGGKGSKVTEDNWR